MLVASNPGTNTYDCDMCGKFKVTKSLLAGQLNTEKATTLTPMQRAVLAHHVRKQSMENKETLYELNTTQFAAVKISGRL
jgi:hypothetical protein